MNLNRTGPPGQAFPGRSQSVNRGGPPMNTALGRIRKRRIQRAAPKRGPRVPNTPV